MDATTTGGGLVQDKSQLSLLYFVQELSSGASGTPLDLHPLENGVVALFM